MEDLKGKYEGNCNRTACQKPNAIWYNHSTRLYYCPKCAELLNKVNPEAQEMFGHVLCTLGKPVEEIEEVEDPLEGLDKFMEYQKDVNEIFEFQDTYHGIEMDNLTKRAYPSVSTQVLVPVRTSAKIGRNAKCPCDSGKKFKQCCINK